MSAKKAKKTPTKKKNTSDLSEADAIAFITALSKTQVGIKQIAYLLMKATKGSPNKKEVQKSIASSLQIMVGEGEDKKMVQKGKSVRVYKLKSGYKKLKGVPEEKNYTPTPAPENGKDQLPGLYGKVVEVDTVNHRLKVRMWFHADGVFPITAGAHSKAKVVPFKRTDGGPSTLTFIHLVKWLDPSQVHRVGAGPLMKFVKGVLLGAEVAKEEYEAADCGMEDLTMCSTTDEDEELNLDAEAGEQSDPEDPMGEEHSGEEEEEDEEETEED